MAPCSHKDLKVKMKEVKIPHLTNVNKKKMEMWGLGGLFAVDWNQTHEDLVEELSGHSDQKVAFPKYEYHVNSILAPVRPEHFQHNQLAFYHYTWVAIKDPTAPMPDWGDAMEKTMVRQVKALGVCNEATCLGPYLTHMYSHFHKTNNE
ncbi:hypothetical protein R1flu_008668 [Riccia fluitans]|uniref:Uncharacterized protein n=1 Tax=Riccia fluitans TaxID=41844 RepID=A0ABD1YCL5_9MARC